MIEYIPPAVLDAFWALLIAVIGWAMAYIQTKKKDDAEMLAKAVIAENNELVDERDQIVTFYDPKSGNTPVPPGVPKRSYLMNEETKAYLVNGLNPVDREKLLRQVAEAESAGKTDYYIMWSDGYYHIEFGLISGSGRGTFEPSMKAASV